MATDETEAGPAREGEEESGPIVTEPGDSIGTLVRGIVGESVSLLRQEIELARVEMAEKVALLRRYTVASAVGIALLACAFFFLLSAVDRGLTVALGAVMPDSIAVWLAPLLLAAIAGGVGLLLLRRAKRKIAKEGLVPERTVETLRDNTNWIKERLR